MNSAVEAAQAFLDENALVYIGVEDAAERLAESMRSAVRAEIAQELLEVSMARFPISPQVFDITDLTSVIPGVAVAALKTVEVEFEFGSVKPQVAVANAIRELEGSSAASEVSESGTPVPATRR
tara:strand:- start:19830 stop:20201 length:372 start_codon:yes stop_codon:yes gene_type:complete